MKLQFILERANGTGRNIAEDIIQVDGSYYLVNTHPLRDKFETLVYRCDKDGNVIDYDELDVQVYDSEKEALENHKAIVYWKDKYIYHCIFGGTDSDYEEYKLRKEMYKKQNDDDDEDDEEYDRSDDGSEDNIKKTMSAKVLATKHSGEQYKLAVILSIMMDGSYQIAVHRLFDDDSLSKTHFHGRFKLENTEDMSDEELMKFVADTILMNVDLDFLLKENPDDDNNSVQESRLLPTAYEFILEGKLGKLLTTGLAAATILGASCTSQLSDAEREAAEKSIKNAEIELAVTPQKEKNYKEVSDWINNKMDSVYNTDNAMVYNGPFKDKLKDLFEKFIGKTFETSRELKAVPGTFPVYSKSVKDGDHSFIYVPEETDVKKMNELWDEYKKGNYTDYHWRADSADIDTDGVFNGWADYAWADFKHVEPIKNRPDNRKFTYNQGMPAGSNSTVSSPVPIDDDEEDEKYKNDSIKVKFGKGTAKNKKASKSSGSNGKVNSGKSGNNNSDRNVNLYMDPRHKKW